MAVTESFRGFRRIGFDKTGIAVGQVQGKIVNLPSNTGYDRPGFAEVDLGMAGVMGQRHKHLFAQALPGPDIIRHDGDATAITMLVAQPFENAFAGMALLLRLAFVIFQDLVDDAGIGIKLRVRPETLCRITEFSEHESNGRELDEGERVAVEVLPVLGQSAAAVEPGDGAFDHPTPGLDDEALHPIGSLDDLGLEIGQDAGQGAVKDRALIGAVGEHFPEKGKQTEQGRQQRETAVAILNVGGGDDAVQQQALRIDQNMPLLALDQLAGIEAVAVDASPPFSALFTL